MCSQEQEQRLIAVLRSISDAVIITDAQGCITFTNTTAEVLMGWTQAEAFGKHLANILITRDTSVHDSLMSSPQKSQRLGFSLDQEIQTMIRTRDGQEIPIHGSIDPIRDDSGNTTGMVVIFRDITMHVQSEEARRQNAKRLENLRAIDRTILSAQSLEEIAQTTLQRLRPLVHYTRANVVVFDFDTREAEVLAMYVNSGTAMNVGTRLPLEHFPVARASWHNEGRILADMLKLEQPAPVVQTLRTEEIRSCLSVPLVVQNTLIGSLNIGTDDPTTFGTEQVEIAREVANQLAIAIQNTRLFTQVQRYAVNLEQRVKERTAELLTINKRLQQEIAERKHTEKALTKAFARLEELTIRLTRSRDTLQTLLEGLDDGLLLLNSDACILAVNHAFARLFHTTPENLVGHDWVTLCNQTNPVFPSEPALLTLHDGRARRQRERYSSQRRQTLILDIQTLPLYDPNQRVEQVILHVVDVTEHVHLEGLVIENERFAASGKLAATMAHEINTPLQAIQTFLYLANETTESQRQQYLALAGDEIDRISRIVQQLLDFYRPKLKPPHPIDINVLIERVLLLTSGTLMKHGIDVERDLTPNLAPLWGDADHLTQVLLNIILNAVAAMPNGGQLRFHTRIAIGTEIAMNEQQLALPTWSTHPVLQSGHSIVLQISDSGSGIPPDVQPRIFDPFFTTKPNGSGLGLTVSRRIIVQHGGHVAVQSEPDKGTIFTIVLPLEQVSNMIEEG